VLNRYLITVIARALVALISSAVVLIAQAPSGNTPSQTPPTPAAQQPARTPASGTPAPDAFVGCVYHEKDLPGRSPNLTERAGLAENYVLAEVPSSPIAAARGSSSRDVARAMPPAIGTSGAADIVYKLQLVDRDKLKALVGRRVEVIGRIETGSGNRAAPPTAQPAPTDTILGGSPAALVTLDVTAIREVAGTCPPMPDPRPQ
jgi:hypothetical protein